MSSTNSSSRIRNTKRIMSSGMIYFIIKTIFPFINRTVIIYTLGSEFTGLSGLFSSVLQVLNLAEFGMSLAVVYSLYEPLARDDTQAINQIMAWMRKVYHLVGGAVFCGGLIAAPFLPRLIRGRCPDGINIYILFFIFLFDSGISYFLFSYKEVLLIADQRRDILSKISSVVKIAVNLLQFTALLFFRNYYLYAVILICGTVGSNLLVNRAVTKRYPYLDSGASRAAVPASMKKELIGLMINRLSNVSRNAFDNLIITATLGLTATAVYGNYYLIYTAVFSVTSVFSDSMQASVGNSISVRSEAKNFENLLDFSMLYAWITGWCATAMACLYQPFMKLWVGEKLMLSEGNMLLFAVYFYLISMNHIRNQYILGNALWWDLKWIYLLEAAANLVLNLVLGHFWGVTGVLLATILTIFFCNYLMCNAVLFRRYFKHASIGLFYRQQFYYLLCAAVVCGGVYLICRMTGSIFLRAGICIVLPNLLYFLLFLPCSRRQSCTAIIKRLMHLKSAG